MYEIYPILIFVLLNFIAAAPNVIMYVFFKSNLVGGLANDSKNKAW